MITLANFLHSHIHDNAYKRKATTLKLVFIVLLVNSIIKNSIMKNLYYLLGGWLCLLFLSSLEI